MRETEFGLSAKFKLFKDFSLDRRSTSFERSSSSFNLAVTPLVYITRDSFFCYLHATTYVEIERGIESN